jgi:hypothetical protein
MRRRGEALPTKTKTGIGLSYGVANWLDEPFAQVRNTPW